MTNIELWFHRIFIALLLIGMVVVMQGNKQAQYMGLKNLELIEQNTKDIHDLAVSDTKILEIIEMIIDKMPDKK